MANTKTKMSVQEYLDQSQKVIDYAFSIRESNPEEALNLALQQFKQHRILLNRIKVVAFDS